MAAAGSAGENLLLSPSPVNGGLLIRRLIQRQLKGTSEWPFLVSESPAEGPKTDVAMHPRIIALVGQLRNALECALRRPR
jgi:hypothetical protein